MSTRGTSSSFMRVPGALPGGCSRSLCRNLAQHFVCHAVLATKGGAGIEQQLGMTDAPDTILCSDTSDLRGGDQRARAAPHAVEIAASDPVLDRIAGLDSQK